jgi:hypothetical protein
MNNTKIGTPKDGENKPESEDLFNEIISKTPSKREIYHLYKEKYANNEKLNILIEEN